MAKVLFTHSYFYRFDTKQWKTKQPYPPLGTILAAAVARENGFTVSVFDTNLAKNTEEIITHLQHERPEYVVIYDDSFNYLTKMCLTNMREAAFDLAKRAKKYGCVTIVSGSDATDHYEKYFANAVDYVIRGEGEETLKELLICLDKRGDTSLVPGIAFKKFGQTVVTQERPVIRNLDLLPMAAWDLIDIEKYRKIWMKAHGYFSLNIATTRGCPFKCNWCAKPIYGNRYNSRSPEKVIAEIKMLQSNYRVSHFWMTDDIFGLKPGWVQEFNTQAKKHQLNFRYKIQSRADLLIEKNTVNALAESGAETVWIGAESGSQAILDAMDKGTTVAQIKNATLLLRKHGIKVGFFLQFGYLNETAEDIEKTIKMLLDVMPDEIGISISYPLPGTKFYETVKSQLQKKQNWKDSKDLDMMFQSTFNSSYYRQLHQYVHHLYQKQKSFRNLKKIIFSPLSLTYQDIRSGLKTFYYIPSTFNQKFRLKKLQAAQINVAGR